MIEQSSDYRIRSFHQYDDDGYRNARSPAQRLLLRVKTFIIFPLRFLLHARQIERTSDLLIVTTSPFFLPFLAALVINRRRTRVIVLVNDIYPEALVAKGLIAREGTLEKIMKRLFDRAMGKVAAVVFLSSGHRKFVSEYARLPAIASVIPVSGHSDPFADHRLENPPGITEVTYCGTLGLMHDFSTFIKWLERGRGISDVKFSFYTSGASKRKFEAQVSQLLRSGSVVATVVLGDALSEADWTRLMKRAHVGLVFQDVGSGSVIFPSKIASILAAGQAVLAVAEVDSDVGRLVLQNDCGWVVPPDDICAFANAISDLRNSDVLLRKRTNAFRLGHTEFSLVGVASRWMELLDSTVAAGTPI